MEDKEGAYPDTPLLILKPFSAPLRLCGSFRRFPKDNSALAL
jgi:hypothetical protein